MPVIKSAKKKLRKDKKRESANKKLKEIFKKTLKQASRNPSEANIKKAFKITDKTAKKGIIHKNKAARIKSGLARLTGGKKSVAKAETKSKKTVTKSTSKRKSKKK